MFRKGHLYLNLKIIKMRKRELKFVLLVLVISSFLFPLKCFSQWQTDLRLTNNLAVSELSDNNAKCIAANGNNVHVVWVDTRDGNFEIYYKRSSDGGVNWGADTRLTNDPAASRYPSIAVNGSDVHIVWHDERFNREIYYKHSSDGGITWGADTRLTNNVAGSWYPSISVSGQIVSVVWQDERDSLANNIYFKYSTNSGTTWGADIPVTSRPTNSTYASVASINLTVHVAWCDVRSGITKIYYKRSTNGGINWQGEIKLTDDDYTSSAPSISVSGQNIYAVWSEYINGISYAYYKRSTDGGNSWINSTVLTIGTFYITNPNIFASGSNVHIVMKNDSSGHTTIFYLRSTNNGVNWSSFLPITSNNSLKNRPSIFAADQTVHVVWMDNRDTNFEIYYNRNPTANVGIQKISTEIPQSFSLKQNYPNPFNPSTSIHFNVGSISTIKIVVYDIQGHEVQIMVNEKLSAGTYETTFDGSGLNSGVFFLFNNSRWKEYHNKENVNGQMKN